MTSEDATTTTNLLDEDATTILSSTFLQCLYSSRMIIPRIVVTKKRDQISLWKMVYTLPKPKPARRIMIASEEHREKDDRCQRSSFSRCSCPLPRHGRISRDRGSKPPVSTLGNGTLLSRGSSISLLSGKRKIWRIIPSMIRRLMRAPRRQQTIQFLGHRKKKFLGCGKAVVPPAIKRKSSPTAICTQLHSDNGPPLLVPPAQETQTGHRDITRTGTCRTCTRTWTVGNARV